MLQNGDPKPASDGKIWIYFETSTNNEWKSICYSTNGITGMWVDGVQVPVSTTYTFPEIGEHLVKLSVSGLNKYQFNDFHGTRVYLPTQITSLPKNCFNQSSNLREVTLYGNVTSFAAAAFANCAKLFQIIIYATTPPTLGNTNVFSAVPYNRVLFVPYTSDHSVLDAYKAWDSSRSRYMFELEPDGTKSLHMLNYIDSSGAQYIKTGIKPVSTTGLIVDASMLSLGGMLAGANFSNHSFYIKSNASNWVFNCKGTGFTFSTPSPDLLRHKFEIRGDGFCSIDSYIGQVGTPPGGALPINIFTASASATGDPDTNNYVSMRFFNAVIKSGDTIVRNYVPARINQFAGIYDTLTTSFYLSNTSTDFIPGTDVQ